MLRRTQLKKGNSTLSQKNSLLSKANFSLKKTPLVAKNNQKTIKKQSVNVKTLYKNLNYFLETHDWKKLRLIGLDLFSKVVRILAKGKCEKCGKVGTDAHHWCYTKSKGGISDIMPINGIFLCRKCHIEAHDNFNLFKIKVTCLDKYEKAEEELKKALEGPMDFNLVEKIITDGLKVVEEYEQKVKKQKEKMNGTDA